MKETSALIERITRVNDVYQRIHIKLADAPGRIKPGHSLLARPLPGWHPYLAQRWWPVDIQESFLLIERPINEHYDVGQVVPVMGFIGQPYRFRRNLRSVLLIAHQTPPHPLLLTVPWLLSNKIDVTLVLTGSAADYDAHHLPELVEIIRGDDDGSFSWPNQVLTVGNADQVFVTVDPANETDGFRDVVDRFTELRASIGQNYLWGIFRPALPCGAGACGACMLTTRGGTALACTIGPAFDLSQLPWLLPSP